MFMSLIQQAQPAGSPGTALGANIIMIALIGLIFYFLIIRPQSQRVKKHKAMIDAVTRGDEVITNGGLIGKVKKVSDTELTLTLGPNMEVKVLRTMVADVRNRKSAAND